MDQKRFEKRIIPTGQRLIIEGFNIKVKDKSKLFIDVILFTVCKLK